MSSITSGAGTNSVYSKYNHLGMDTEHLAVQAVKVCPVFLSSAHPHSLWGDIKRIDCFKINFVLYKTTTHTFCNMDSLVEMLFVYFNIFTNRLLLIE